jgi:hypothetical protein
MVGIVTDAPRASSSLLLVLGSKTPFPLEPMSSPATPGRVAAWGLALYTLTRIIGVVFASASMASAVGQAIAAEWGAGRLGVTWSDPHEKLPTTRQIARRALLGAACGVGAAAALVIFAAATRAALVEKIDGSTPWSLVALGLVTAALMAMRDELLLHGITLRALAPLRSPVARSLACGVTSAAAALGDPTATWRLAMVHFLVGTALGALWVRDRGAWMAWGAHAAWLFVVGTVFGGGVAQTRVADTPWGGSDAGILGGSAAVLVLVPITLVALSLVRRDGSRVGSRASDGG